MDRQEEHEQHHQEERGRKKDERKQHEQAQQARLRTIHPAWFVVLGVILIFAVVISWTLL
jgi:type VI protein secretion system component VasF